MIKRIPATDRLNLFGKMMLRLRPLVSTQESDILLFIFMRTVYYGKIEETITIRQFMNGIFSQEEVIYPGVKVCRTTLFKALRKLSDNDIIQRRESPGNKECYIYSLMLPELQEYVTLQSAARTEEYAGRTDEYTGRTPSPTESNNMIKLHEETAAPHPALAAASDKIKTTTEKYNNARERKKNKLKAHGLEEIWADSFKETFPEAANFRLVNRDSARLKQAMDRGVPTAKQREFLEWSIRNWTITLRLKFKWMKEKPETPSLGFFASRVAEFYDAFVSDTTPNLAADRRVREAVSTSRVAEAPRQPAEEKLQLELSKARARAEELERERNEAQQALHAERKDRTKRLVLKRPTGSKEFGKWRDDG